MFKISHNQLSYHGKLVRWGILGFSSTPIFGTYLYNKGYQLQFLVCPIKHFTGIPCPTCGMTSSFMAIARGDFHQAITENLFGPLLFFGFIITAVHVTLELILNSSIKAFYWQIITSKKIQIMGLCMILINYCTQIYLLSKTGELTLSFIHSPLFKTISEMSGYF